MTKDLLIISAGQFGREVYAWVLDAIAHGADWRFKGFLDSRPGILEKSGYDEKVVGDVDSYAVEPNDVFIGAIGDPAEKLKFYTPIVERGGQFINLVHPTANVGRNVALGTGDVLAPYSSITCDSRIGSHVVIGSFSNAGHDTRIGDWCQISGHCGINGGVVLEDEVFLGSHACLVPQLRIGAKAYVGAGSVVLHDVAAGKKVFGNPAIVIGNSR